MVSRSAITFFAYSRGIGIELKVTLRMLLLGS